jgi:hypothetical protein
MKDPTLKTGVIKDLVLLSCVGVKPVLVHGGGPEINAWLAKVNIEPNFKNGLRVTGELPPDHTFSKFLHCTLSSRRSVPCQTAGAT